MMLHWWWTVVHTLQADECQLSDADLTYLPALPDTLRALSLNKNGIESLLGR